MRKFGLANFANIIKIEIICYKTKYNSKELEIMYQNTIVIFNFLI